MKHEHSGNLAVPTEFFRNRHVKFGGHDITGVINTEGGIEGINPLGFAFPIAGPERPKNILVIRLIREIGQAIDPAMLSSPMSMVDVIRMIIDPNPRRDGLTRRKIALLGRCYFKKSLFWRLGHCTYLIIIMSIVQTNPYCKHIYLNYYEVCVIQGACFSITI
ncbi:MAG: hypothetical protein COV45_09280 [Deltaproteobacteria bacterium CG11_big_fil_rev_8_21_14_0_20_47_16]|nr:MAG: hypothetical protein COV45_09280 [Deltaproteobacteria bacterium CG11_big_fil_rev_8_21_14_0_20_47_16]